MSKRKEVENHKKDGRRARRGVDVGVETSVDIEEADDIDTTTQSRDPTPPTDTTTSRSEANSLSGAAYGLSCLGLLSSRQLCDDPYLSFSSSFKPSFYSLKSLVQRLKLERQLEEHEGCVNCINFSHGGELLSSGSDDLHVVVWDWARGRKVTKFYSGHSANVFQTKFMPHTGDSVLVTAARDGQIRCHVMSTTGELMTSKKVSHHRDSAHKADDKKCEPVKMYCPDHLKNPEHEFSRANITCLVYSHDGKELLCSYNDEDIYLFDTSHSSGSNFIKKYKGHRNSATVKGVNFYGLHSEYVVSGSDCGHVFLWDKETEEIVQFMEGDQQGVVNCLEPHPHIPVLATSGLDHDVKIFSPTAATPTTLDGLDEIVRKNTEDRDESMNTPLDGYELFLHVIMRQYRRGLHAEDNSDDSSDDGLPNGVLLRRLGRGHDDDDDDDVMDSDDDESDEEGEGGGGGRRSLRRCTQQ